MKLKPNQAKQWFEFKIAETGFTKTLKGILSMAVCTMAILVGVGGLEPPASRSRTVHSSQLSYTPTS